MALTSADGATVEAPAQSPAGDDENALTNLSEAEMQALAEKVMALLKRDLRLERERLLGR